MASEEKEKFSHVWAKNGEEDLLAQRLKLLSARSWPFRMLKLCLHACVSSRSFSTRHCGHEKIFLIKLIELLFCLQLKKDNSRVESIKSFSKPRQMIAQELKASHWAYRWLLNWEAKTLICLRERDSADSCPTQLVPFGVVSLCKQSIRYLKVSWK